MVLNRLVMHVGQWALHTNLTSITRITLTFLTSVTRITIFLTIITYPYLHYQDYFLTFLTSITRILPSLRITSTSLPYLPLPTLISTRITTTYLSDHHYQLPYLPLPPLPGLPSLPSLPSLPPSPGLLSCLPRANVVVQLARSLLGA